MELRLIPPVDFRIRIPILIVLLLPVVLAPNLGLGWRLLACFMPLALSGTFRITRFKGEWLHTCLYLGFVPVRRHKCKLAAIVHIGTKYGGSEPGMWTYILFGPVQWIFSWIFDYLIPAIGGPFELWVETARGREFIVWQGFHQGNFEQNLDLLRNQSGGEIRAR